MYNVTFYLRRLHSIAGLVCLGGFLLEHILTNARVLSALSRSMRRSDLLASHPAVHHATAGNRLLCDAVPVPCHLWRLHRLAGKEQPAALQLHQQYPVRLQRLTAWFLVVFLAWHVFYLRILVKGGGTHISFQLLQSYFAKPCGGCFTSSVCGRRFSISATASRRSA